MDKHPGSATLGISPICNFAICGRRNFSLFVLTLLGKRLLSLVLAYVPFLFGFAIAFSILLKVNLLQDAAFQNDEKVVFDEQRPNVKKQL
jgi:hypothetical protein